MRRAGLESKPSVEGRVVLANRLGGASELVALDTAPIGHSLLLFDATGSYYRQTLAEMNALVVLILFGLMQALRSFGSGAPASSNGVSLALGYLLLTGYFVGRMFAGIRLPKLTGYIITGIAAELIAKATDSSLRKRAYALCSARS